MAAEDTTLSYLNTGQLSYGCSDLSAAYPHGGTALGVVSSVVFSPPSGSVRLPAEEDNTTRGVVWTGGDAVLGLKLVSWDQDALAAFFPNTSTSNGETLVEWPGSSLVVGGKLSALTPLVFTPRRSDQPGIILYNSTPLVEASAQLHQSSVRWLEVPMLFVGTPNGSGNVAAMGTFTELSL